MEQYMAQVRWTEHYLARRCWRGRQNYKVYSLIEGAQRRRGQLAESIEVSMRILRSRHESYQNHRYLNQRWSGDFWNPRACRRTCSIRLPHQFLKQRLCQVQDRREINQGFRDPSQQNRWPSFKKADLLDLQRHAQRSSHLWSSSAQYLQVLTPPWDWCRSLDRSGPKDDSCHH